MKPNGKKILSVLITAVTAFVIAAFSGCGGCAEKSGEDLKLKIVAPDGAPALAIAQLIKENKNFSNRTEYSVVSASDIKNYITGSGEKADIALVPVNVASLLIGDGAEYKAVATVTHGNLYLLSLDQTTVNKENVDILKGKTVAVVNIANVPGLTFKAVLKNEGIEFTEDENQKTDDNVLLTGISGTDIASTLNQKKADYVVAPEPAVSTITGKVPAIKKVGALHEIYGNYPQAIMVVKNSLLEKNKDVVKAVYDAMEENQEWIVSHPAEAAEAVASALPEGVTASFTAENTTENSVKGCNIKITPFSSEQIETVKKYIADIKGFGTTSQVAKDFADAFFVDINE